MMKRFYDLVATSATTATTSASAASTTTAAISTATAAVASATAAVSAAAAAEATTTAAAAEATTTAATCFLRPSFIDGQCTSANFMTVECRYRSFCLLIGAHLYKTKSLGSSRISIGYHPSG